MLTYTFAIKVLSKNEWMNDWVWTDLMNKVFVEYWIQFKYAFAKNDEYFNGILIAPFYKLPKESEKIERPIYPFLMVSEMKNLLKPDSKFTLDWI